MGELKDNPLQAYLEDVFTIPVNLAGLPGISIPCGTVTEEGKQLPIGMQIIAPHLQEARMLQAAHALGHVADTADIEKCAGIPCPRGNSR